MIESTGYCVHRFLLLGESAEPVSASLAYLISILVLGIALLLGLILRYKVQAFFALLLCSVVVGVLASRELTGVEQGLSLSEIGDVIKSGMGSSLGFIAAIIGLGAIFGALLEHSGGAERLALSLVAMFGEKRSDWAMLLAGFIISIPVFFDVALVIMAPIIYAMARRTGLSVLAFALPLLAGIMVTHSFVPPTPGPVWVAYELNVSLGRVIIFGVVVGLPTAIITGIYGSKFLARHLFVEPPALELDQEAIELGAKTSNREMPSFGMILALIGGPILLIVVATLLKEYLAFGIESGLSRSEYATAAAGKQAEANAFFQLLIFLGHPIIALMLATLAALIFLGYARGVDRNELMDVCAKSLGPAGIIILITGAGGVFKGMLGATGISDALRDAFAQSGLSVLFLAYLFAVLVRVAQGSATIAMVTAAGLVSSMTSELNPSQLALVVIAIAAGSSIASHVNDSGFWMVSRYFRMDEKQTLQTWTVLSTAVSVVGYVIAQLLWFLV